MHSSPNFDRLVQTAEMIARHVDYPGKRQVVGQWMEDVEDLSRSGHITQAQGHTLLQILLRAYPAPTVLEPALSA